MSRQPRLLPADLDAGQAALYARITGGPRASGPQLFDLTDGDGALQGPFGGFLLAPALGDRLQALGTAVRYETSLTDRSREIAILVVAAHWRSTFERHAHEAVGRHCGLTGPELIALREGADLSLHDPVEQACLDLTRSLVTGDVDDTTWRACTGVLGTTTAYELIVLVGYYSTLALQMRVLRVG
jgi:4-carboxymuconolactone decarboxylase